jgi:hypothetical protein
MPSKENILVWLDRSILFLAQFVEIIPGKADDLALSFLKWARNDETFLDWLEKFEAPAPGAFTAPPEALVDAIRRWNTETGGGTANATNPGQWMELLNLVLQIAAWIQKRRGTPAPAPV